MCKEISWTLARQSLLGVSMAERWLSFFFVIAGYAFSGRVLKLMRNRHLHPNAILRALASSTFRRWFRLYASTGLASFADGMFVHFRLIENDLRKDSFIARVWDWLCDSASLSNPFASIEGFWHPGVFASKYLNILWTIPAEFPGSITVFWFSYTRNCRIFAFAIIFLCYIWGVLYCSSFLSGLLIADYALDRTERHDQLQHLVPGDKLLADKANARKL